MDIPDAFSPRTEITRYMKTAGNHKLGLLTQRGNLNTGYETVIINNILARKNY